MTAKTSKAARIRLNPRFLRFCDCLICGRDLGRSRDELNLDRTEEGVRLMGWGVSDHILPPARYRDRIAPDMCDHCWLAYKAWMNGLRRHGRRGWPKCALPFRTIYVWAWVAERLENKARRLTPHLAAKASRGREVLNRAT